MDKTITAVIQARTGSTRLPGKVLKNIAGEPMVVHVIRRVQAASKIGRVILATTTHHNDNTLADIAHNLAIGCIRGSETDVLDRYYQVAKHYKLNIIVRITADCPVIDPAIIDATIGLFESGAYAYVSNVMHRTFPVGLDVEVFTADALEIAWKEAAQPSEREHVTPYFYHNPQKFPQAGLVQATDMSHYRWTVDRHEDLELIKAIYAGLYEDNPLFNMQDILMLLEKNPDLLKLNVEFAAKPAEGMLKSLQEDAQQAAEEKLFEHLSHLHHGLKSPAGSLKAYADILLRDKEEQLELPEAERYQILRQIYRSANANHAIISSIYTLMEIELRRKPRVRFEKVVVSALFEKIIRDLKLLIQRSGRTLTIGSQVGDKKMAVQADSHALHLGVLDRIVDNAFRYTRDGGTITLSAQYTADKENVLICVKDTGIGIVPEDKNLIFEPYKNGSNLQDILPGAGISLAVAKAYIEAMDGTIYFESEAGNGTIFYIQLPVYQDLKKQDISS